MMGHLPNSLLNNRALWEQPYLDLWSIPHVLTGVIIALCAAWVGLAWWRGFLAALIIAVAWEAFEKITRYSSTEYASNQVSDVVMSLLGFALMYASVVRWNLAARRDILARTLSVFLAITLAVCVVGWNAFSIYAQNA